MIIAFKLKRISAESSTEQNGNHKPATESASAPETEGNKDSTKDNVEVTDEKVPEDIKDEDNDEKVDKEDPEDGSEDDEQAPAEEKLSVAACKDNKDIVMREDLKSVFQKFGTVKVNFLLYLFDTCSF